MNAPDIPARLNITAKQRDDSQSSGSAGQSLDDVASLFPGMSVFHDLHISGEGDTELLHAVSILIRDLGVKIVKFTLRGCDSGQTCVKCRLSGLTSEGARELVGRLLVQRDVKTARVEHVILRA